MAGTGKGFTTRVKAVLVRLAHDVTGSKASAYHVPGPEGVYVLLFDATGVPPAAVAYQFTSNPLPAVAVNG